MLASERASIGGGTSVRGATALLAMVQELGIDGDPVVRQEVVAAIARERLLDLVQARIAAGRRGAGGRLGRQAAVHRARPAHVRHRAAPRRRRRDDRRRPLCEPWVDRFLFAPGLRIGGGTDEIQRNTIAERASACHASQGDERRKR